MANDSAGVHINEPATRRFAFGRNWSRFLTTLDENRIADAASSLRQLLGVENLTGRRFLDAGSGSGLFSLAAYQLGAEVTSFDVDPQSIACTEELRMRFAADDTRWNVTSGSLLDSEFLATLGTFDIVYCWGVAHHTGDMWRAIDHLVSAVSADGLVVLAIYNDQLHISRAWRAIKRIYQLLPGFLRPLYVGLIGTVEFAKRALVTLLACLLRLVAFRNPFVPIINWASEGKSRGMHVWYDLIDWVGGWPFEVAKPEEVFRFVRDRGFVLRELITSGGHGCNEFVFVRKSLSSGPEITSGEAS
jgi:2-polyprenyl-6-hydroxyphenyl methylase/3-demethylubiquinone-9 3-methyltransferase